MSRLRQKTAGQAHHTDDWLITYADMITLLLSFFVILFVVLSAKGLHLNVTVGGGALKLNAAGAAQPGGPAAIPVRLKNDDFQTPPFVTARNSSAGKDGAAPKAS